MKVSRTVRSGGKGGKRRRAPLRPYLSLLLLLPDSERVSYDDLSNMVSHINQAEVPLEDQLSNQIYHYSRELDAVRLISPAQNSACPS